MLAALPTWYYLPSDMHAKTTTSCSQEMLDSFTTAQARYQPACFRLGNKLSELHRLGMLPTHDHGKWIVKAQLGGRVKAHHRPKLGWSAQIVEILASSSSWSAPVVGLQNQQTNSATPGFGRATGPSAYQPQDDQVCYNLVSASPSGKFAKTIKPLPTSTNDFREVLPAWTWGELEAAAAGRKSVSRNGVIAESWRDRRALRWCCDHPSSVSIHAPAKSRKGSLTIQDGYIESQLRQIGDQAQLEWYVQGREAVRLHQRVCRTYEQLRYAS